MLYILIIILLVGLDQYSKYLIVKNISLNSNHLLIKDFFNITYVRNYGAGFSIMQNQRIFLILVSLIVIVVLCYLIIKENKKNKLNIICYVLIIAGSIGNLIDRCRLSYVVDFLDFYIFGYDFPVFNIADCFITVGCILLIISIFLEEKHAKN